MGLNPATAVQHDAEHRQFWLLQDGLRSVLDYRLEGEVLVATHTGVPPELRGRGIAEQLTRAMLAACEAHGWALRPLCTYTAAFVRRHPPAGVRIVD